MIHPKGIADSSLVSVSDNQNPEPSFFCDGCDDAKIKVSPEVMERVLRSMAMFMEGYLHKMRLPEMNVLKDLTEFIGRHQSNPAKFGRGSTHFNRLLWINLIAKSINPELIIESGVFIGRSLWVLRKACPDARMVAFDLNLTKLKFGDSSIEYEEMDWSDSPVVSVSPSDLVLFHDNINNCLRLRQAYDKGFRHVIISSQSVMNMHRHRWPGVPTIQMLQDMRSGDTVEWYCKKKDVVLSYTYEEAHTHGAKEIIDYSITLPSLENFTGLNCPQSLSYVRLV